MLIRNLKIMKTLPVILFLIIAMLSTISKATNITILQTGASQAADFFVSELTQLAPVKAIIDLNVETPKPADDDIFLILGADALQQYLFLELDAPAIAVFVSRRSYYHTLKGYKHLKQSEDGIVNVDNISAVYSDPDITLQLELVKKFYPDKPNAVALLTENTSFMKGELLMAAMETGVVLEILNYKPSMGINAALDSIRDNKVLLAIPDATVWNGANLNNIMLTASRNEQNVVGFSRNLVKSGSLATVYSLTPHFAEQVLLMVNEFEHSNILPEATYSTFTDTMFNQYVSPFDKM